MNRQTDLLQNVLVASWGLRTRVERGCDREKVKVAAAKLAEALAAAVTPEDGE